MISKTERIQRRILIYVIISVILTAVVTSFVAITPLYSKLKQDRMHNLVFVRDTSILVIDEYLSRLNDVSKQIASRIESAALAREVTGNGDVKAHIKKVLTDALEGTFQLQGAIYIDAQGARVTGVGRKIPKGILPANLTSRQIIISQPAVINKHYFITIYTPISNYVGKHLGAVITLLNISDIERNINQRMQFGSVDVFIAAVDGNKLNVFSPSRFPKDEFITKDKLIKRLLVEEAKQKKRSLLNLEDKNLIVAYGTVNLTDWVVAVSVKSNVLYGSLQKNLWVGVSIISLITLFCVIGLVLCLRPLSGRIIMQSQDLRKQIEQGRVKLAEANDKLKHYVDHDFLTNIANRKGFTETLEKELSRATRTKTKFVLAYIDVDRFKKINDEHGHLAGDILLKTFAERLNFAMRKEDMVARLGGDEFAIIAPNFAPEKANLLIDKINRVAAISVSFEGQEINFTVSVGVARYPEDGKDQESLLHTSDKAMYEAKERFRRENP